MIGASYLFFGVFWLWKGFLSRQTTTGVGNQFLQGLSSRYARGRVSHAAAQRAAAFPCFVMGVALAIAGLLALSIKHPTGLVESLGAGYFLIVQIAGYLWAQRRADNAARLVGREMPNERPRY